MQVIDRKNVVDYIPQAYGDYADSVKLEVIESSQDHDTYMLSVREQYKSKSLYVKWRLPAIGVKGAWTTNSILDKRFKTDWESPKLNSSISVDAPIISLYGHNDENILTVACSDLVNYLPMEASLREEDNHFYFVLHFFTQAGSSGDYETTIRLDRSPDNFSHVIQRSSQWTIEASGIKTRGDLPPLAQTPLYSTWYSFHQNLEEEKLLLECQNAKAIGYDLIIIDDGWQTLDDNRGYDYTGDWRNERFADVRLFVERVHQIGMGVMFWYSVPFCGVKSEAYKTFKGKFLTENHHWAPVFDPRFADVRSYLVSIYVNALIEWDLDGFKLDFIDDFKVYPETVTDQLQGRDTLSVSEGVWFLIKEISQALTALNPDVLIEFRQQYISPGLQQLGNMFRAFDCPNDSVLNRVRTTDVKLLFANNSATHSDMFTWNKDEDLEIAALQLSSILFSVPQLSVLLEERSEREIDMIRFFTSYWRENKSTLMDGQFTAFKPMSNYPMLRAVDSHKTIIGVYEDVVVSLQGGSTAIDIINGKMSQDIVIDCQEDLGRWSYQLKNCMGHIVEKNEINLNKQLHKLRSTANGIIFLTKLPVSSIDKHQVNK